MSFLSAPFAKALLLSRRQASLKKSAFVCIKSAYLSGHFSSAHFTFRNFKISILGRLGFAVLKPVPSPLVPRVQKIKIRNLTLNRLLIVEFVKEMVYLGAHYSERQGLMG